MTGILKVDQWKDSGDNALMTSDGAGNLTANVSIAGFSSTGIDDNASSTAMTIDSSGEILVGTTSTDNANQGVRLKNYGLINGTATSDVCLLLNRRTSNGTIAQFRKDNAVVGNIDVSSSGISINLGGTAAANTLDDYETGTWTPVFTSFSATVQKAEYTKIGNLVIVQGYFSSLGSGTGGNAFIEGLPFPNSLNGWAPFIINGQFSSITSAQILGRVEGNSSKIAFKNNNDGNFTGTQIVSSSFLTLCAVYRN